MIKVGSALIEHAEQLERERGIPKDLVLSSLKEAMLAAYKRFAHLPDTEGLLCKLIERTGEIGVFELKKVVEDVSASVKEWEDREAQEAAEEAAALEAEEDALMAATEDDPEAYEAAYRARPHVERKKPVLNKADRFISLKDARRLKPDVELGDSLEIEVTPEEFGRIAAQSAKQVITQRIREAEKMLIQKEFEEKRGSVTSGIVQRIEGRNVIVNIGKSDALLPPKEQIPSEYYRVGNKLRVFVLDIRDSGRIPQIIVSQAHPVMVREVFELEVPEIEDGLVEIKNIAREAGFRTKVAVHSTDPDVDPQGACIGTRGSRIQAIVNELKNEKIDIIRWSENPVAFITNALAPAKIVNVTLNLESEFQKALVVVPDDQLSLAIGREGQNVRLAAKLTGYKLDIKSLSQVQAEYGPELDFNGNPVDGYGQPYGPEPQPGENRFSEAAYADGEVQQGEEVSQSEAQANQHQPEETSTEAFSTENMSEDGFASSEESVYEEDTAAKPAVHPAVANQEESV